MMRQTGTIVTNVWTQDQGVPDQDVETVYDPPDNRVSTPPLAPCPRDQGENSDEGSDDGPPPLIDSDSELDLPPLAGSDAAQTSDSDELDTDDDDWLAAIQARKAACDEWFSPATDATGTTSSWHRHAWDTRVWRRGRK